MILQFVNARIVLQYGFTGKLVKREHHGLIMLQ